MGLQSYRPELFGECGEPVRGSADPCSLRRDHRRTHSAVTYYCDGCGQSRRGVPYRVTDEDHGDLGFCFLCVVRPRKAPAEDWS